MARDPNEPRGAGQFLEHPDDFKAQGIAIPSGYVIGTSNGQYYAERQVYADGHTTVKWYKRGAGGGTGKPDPVEIETAGPPAQNVKDAWDKEQATATTTAAKSVKSKYQGVFPAGHPRAGMPATVTEYETGDPDYVEIVTPAAQQDDWHTEGRPDGRGGFDNSRPIMVRTVNGVRQTKEPSAKDLEDWNLAGQMTRNPGGRTDAQATAEAKANAPKAGTAYQNAQGQWVQPITDAQGNVTGTQPVPAGAEPKQPPKPPTNVSAPSTQRLIEERVEHPDGTFTVTTRTNPNWKPESKVVYDDKTGKWVQISETAEGGYSIKPVDDQTAIKPTELPVLQAKYGEIAQKVGEMAADLNGRFARGEITEKQRNDAFAAGHQQASVQIAEINSILDNSRQAWRAEIDQRGQTLTDTAGRRTFAGGMLSNAISTGQSIANSSGPGHGAAIAGGVGALLNIGQRYAEGMGGFRESPEIAAPLSVQQARAVGIPGLPMPAGPGAPAAPLPPGSPPVPPPAAGIGAGVSNTTDAGGVPRVMTPASSSTAAPGVSPLVQQMQQQLQGGGMFAGSPAAAGGMGVFDPMAEAEQMLAAQGGQQDNYWAEAVKRAAQASAQRVQPGYHRFMS